MDVYIVGKGHLSTPNPTEECLKSGILTLNSLTKLSLHRKMRKEEGKTALITC